MAKKSILSFLGDQFRKIHPVANADLKEKTVIVLGANTGLGFKATQHFAKMGAGRLILACRSKEKGEAAIQHIRDATGYSTAELWIVDLAEFSSVRAFIDQATKELQRLDILLLNAAVSPGMDAKWIPTQNSWETTIQVNVLSPSLIALLLLPHMINTAKRFNTSPRLVIVSSEVHYWTTFEDKFFGKENAFELLSDKEYCTYRVMLERYNQSKLLNVFFTRALNNRLRNQPIIINTVNPGFCRSELLRGVSDWIVFPFAKLFAYSAEEGSRQLIWAAVGIPEVVEGDPLEMLRGAYIHRSSVNEPSDHVLGEEGKKREDKLWGDLISVLEEVDPHVKNVIGQYLHFVERD